MRTLARSAPPLTRRSSLSLTTACPPRRNAQRVESAIARSSVAEVSQKRAQALLDIAKALASESRLSSLVGTIVRQMPELLDCDRATLYFVDHERSELIVTRGASLGRPKSFVSWIFGQSNAPELPFPPGQSEIRFPLHKGIAGHVGLSGQPVNIRDAHEDARFNPEVDKVTGYRTRSVLCVPMKDAAGKSIGVLQAINKNPELGVFSRDDEILAETFSAQAAMAVKNSKLLEQTQRALDRSEALLDLTNALSKELKVTPLLQIVVEKVQKLLNCARCTVFLVDSERKELYTSDKMSAGMGAALPINHERDDMIRFPMTRGIAGNVATTGVVARIQDAYNDSRFNKEMDVQTKFRTKSILCMAIRNHKGDIIGVTQCINKILRPEEGRAPDPHAATISFDDTDEKMLEAFNAQAAVAIENSRLYSVGPRTPAAGTVTAGPALTHPVARRTRRRRSTTPWPTSAICASC